MLDAEFFARSPFYTDEVVVTAGVDGRESLADLYDKVLFKSACEIHHLDPSIMYSRNISN